MQLQGIALQLTIENHITATLKLSLLLKSAVNMLIILIDLILVNSSSLAIDHYFIIYNIPKHRESNPASPNNNPTMGSTEIPLRCIPSTPSFLHPTLYINTV